MNEILSDIEQENENIKNRKIDHELYILSFPLIARMRMNSIPFLNGLLKEYIYESMKKGEYKPIDFSPLLYQKITEMDSTMDDGSIDMDDKEID